MLEQTPGVYDQLVRVEAELTGTFEDLERAERVFGRQPWWIVRRPASAGFAAVHNQEHRGWYVFELYVPDGPARRAARVAGDEVQAVADRAGIPLYVEDRDPLRRSHQPRPVRYECRVGRTDGQRWRLQLSEWARRLGAHDTGRVVTANEEVVVRRLPEGTARAPYLGVGSRHGGGGDMTEVAIGRARVTGTVAMYAVLVCGVLAVTLTAWWLTLLLPACVAAGVTIYYALRRMDGPRTTAVIVTMVTCWAFLAGMGICVRWGADQAGEVVLGVGGILFVGKGLRLLLRTWSSRRILLTLLIALVPVLPPWMLGLGTVSHAFYAVGFGIPSENVAVPDALHVLAALYVFSVMLVVLLVALACWGYLRHGCPWLLDRGVAVMLAASVVAAGGMVWLSAVTDPAVDAASAAKADWSGGRVPGQYWGIKVRPVCITPVVPLGELAVDGGELNPSRVYASFGTVDGWVTLWDARTGDDFSVPADHVRAVPAGPGEPGDAIPRSCDGRGV
ncbi:hypothetical protein [Streptomyces sp. NPDC050988]|uniref:hypothetical protein n=1 Tax=Streptomyces sp. NPDC050988 TaxID=3365637 RepID=UPI0037A077F3